MRRNKTPYRNRAGGHAELFAKLFAGKDQDVELVKGEDFDIDPKSMRSTLKLAARNKGYAIVSGPEVRGDTVVAIHIAPLVGDLDTDDELEEEEEEE